MPMVAMPLKIHIFQLFEHESARFLMNYLAYRLPSFVLKSRDTSLQPLLTQMAVDNISAFSLEKGIASQNKCINCNHISQMARISCCRI